MGAVGICPTGMPWNSPFGLFGEMVASIDWLCAIQKQIKAKT